MMRAVILATVLAISVAACGKSEQQKQAEKAAEDLKKAAEAIGQAAGQAGTAAAAQGATDMAKAMSGMAAALGGAKTADGKPVEPLTFQTLETALPSMSGWEMEKPNGERMTSPFPFSKTEAEYKNGEQSVRVTITDSALAGMMLIPVRMMVASGYSKETSSGYEKATTAAGQPAVEKWEADDKRGELTILANDRFVIEMRGRNVGNVKTLHDFAAKVDLGKLK
jgi:hypothetical protein